MENIFPVSNIYKNKCTPKNTSKIGSQKIPNYQGSTSLLYKLQKHPLLGADAFAQYKPNYVYSPFHSAHWASLLRKQDIRLQDVSPF